MTRVAYLGPRGTFSGEALAGSPLVASGALGEVEPVPFASIHEVVVAVAEGDADRAIVPIENSLEGSVDETLDALVLDAPGIEIVAEAVLPVRHCLIATSDLEDAEITRLASHPQVLGQCTRFVRSLPAAEVIAVSSSAEAVRLAVSSGEPGAAAIGNRLAAELYGAVVVREGIEDHPDNETRFVWLAPAGSGPAVSEAPGWKTSLVFWGRGATGPGWLVACLAELAQRDVNLTRIESRPRGAVMGRYFFFVDLEGAIGEPRVAEAVQALRAHCDEARVLGAYPVAP